MTGGFGLFSIAHFSRSTFRARAIPSIRLAATAAKNGTVATQAPAVAAIVPTAAGKSEWEVDGWWVLLLLALELLLILLL